MKKIVLFLLFGILGFSSAFAEEGIQGTITTNLVNDPNNSTNSSVPGYDSDTLGTGINGSLPSNFSGPCSYDGSGDDFLGGLKSCLAGSALVQDGTRIEGNSFAETLKGWTNTIATFLGVFAVFGIVFGGFRFTISAGEDEKITKAKNIIKWSIIGFVGVLTTTLIVNLIVNIMYSL